MSTCRTIIPSLAIMLLLCSPGFAQGANQKEIGASIEVGDFQSLVMDYVYSPTIRVRATLGFRNISPSATGTSSFSTGLHLWKRVRLAKPLTSYLGGGVTFGVGSGGTPKVKNRMARLEGYYVAEHELTDALAITGRFGIMFEDNSNPTQSVFSTAAALGLTWWIN